MNGFLTEDDLAALNDLATGQHKAAKPTGITPDMHVAVIRLAALHEAQRLQTRAEVRAIVEAAPAPLRATPRVSLAGVTGGKR